MDLKGSGVQEVVPTDRPERVLLFNDRISPP